MASCLVTPGHGDTCKTVVSCWPVGNGRLSDELNFLKWNQGEDGQEPWHSDDAVRKCVQFLDERLLPLMCNRLYCIHTKRGHICSCAISPNHKGPGCSFPRSAGSSKSPRPLHLLESLSKANCRHYKGIVSAGVMIQPVRFLYYIVSSSQSPCYSLSWEPPTTVAGASSKPTKTEAQWLQGLLTRDLCLKMGVAGKLRTQL